MDTLPILVSVVFPSQHFRTKVTSDSCSGITGGNHKLPGAGRAGRPSRGGRHHNKDGRGLSLVYVLEYGQCAC